MPNIIASGKGIGSTAGVRTDSITVPSGTMKFVVFPHWAENSNRTITSVTLGGEGLTPVNSTTGIYLRVGVWELNDPTPGTANLISTCSQSTTSLSHQWACLDDAGNITASSKGETDSISVASAAGELVIGLGVRRSATGVTVGADQTLLQSDLAGASTRSALSVENGAPSVTHSYAWTGGDASTTIVVSIAPAPSGPSPAVLADYYKRHRSVQGI